MEDGGSKIEDSALVGESILVPLQAAEKLSSFVVFLKLGERTKRLAHVSVARVES